MLEVASRNEAPFPHKEITEAIAHFKSSCFGADFAQS